MLEHIVDVERNDRYLFQVRQTWRQESWKASHLLVGLKLIELCSAEATFNKIRSAIMSANVPNDKRHYKKEKLIKKYLQ